MLSGGRLRGHYASGPRQGQRCVAKWFKNGAVFSEGFFTLDIKAVDKALEIVEAVQSAEYDQQSRQDQHTRNLALRDGCEEDSAGQMARCVPYIHSYQKWNSNNGWKDDSTAWGKCMQALSHFSFRISGGRYVLCDLQGGIRHNEVVLSDPVILSLTREYGVTDLSVEGMTTFFSKHMQRVLSIRLDQTS